MHLTLQWLLVEFAEVGEIAAEYLTRTGGHGKIIPVQLGVRLVVGQQTLDLYAEVRILDPQSGWLAISLPFRDPPVAMCSRGARVLMPYAII